MPGTEGRAMSTSPTTMQTQEASENRPAIVQIVFCQPTSGEGVGVQEDFKKLDKVQGWGLSDLNPGITPTVGAKKTETLSDLRFLCKERDPIIPTEWGFYIRPIEGGLLSKKSNPLNKVQGLGLLIEILDPSPWNRKPCLI